MNRRAFTLIELLVVVAIIALLISILMPSLSTAREAARRAVCISNMNQMGGAIHMYTVDSRGVWPNAVRGSNANGTAAAGESWTQGNWGMRILPFVKNVKAFYCASWDYGPYSLTFLEQYARHYPHQWGGFMSYGMNAGQTGDPTGTTRMGFGLFDKFYVRDGEIKMPAASYLFLETWGYGPGLGMPYSYLVGKKGVGWAATYVPFGIMPPNAIDIEVYGLQFRHRKMTPLGLNFGFVDGHVAWQAGEEMMKPLHWRVTGKGVYTPWSGFMGL